MMKKLLGLYLAIALAASPAYAGFQGEKVQGKEASVESTSQTTFKLEDASRKLYSTGLANVISPVMQTVGSGLSDLEVVKDSNYTLTTPITYTITVEDAPAGNLLTTNNGVGNCQQGEQLVGQTSATTANLLLIGGGNTFYVDAVTPTDGFVNETVIGQTSGCEFDIVTIENFDTWGYTDGTNTVTGRIMYTTPDALNNGIIIKWGAQSGHTGGDEFQFTITPTTIEGVKVDYAAGTSILGDETNAINGTSVTVAAQDNITKAESITLNVSPISYTSGGVAGDINLNTNMFNGDEGLTVHYTIEAVSSDTVNWMDDQSHSGSFNPIVDGQLYVLSYGTGISFPDFGSVATGSIYQVDVSRNKVTGLNLDYRNQTYGLGTGTINKSGALVDDLDGEKGSANINSGGVTLKVKYNPDTALSGAHLNSPLFLPKVSSSTGATMLDVDNFSILDAFGQTVCNLSENNVRRCFSALGVEIFDMTNTGVALPNLMTTAFGMQVSRYWQPVYTNQTASYSYQFGVNQPVEYLDATSGNLTVTLPTINGANIYNSPRFQRIDNSNNSVTIIGNGTQVFDGIAGKTSINLAPYDSVDVQTWNTGSTYGFKSHYSPAPYTTVTTSGTTGAQTIKTRYGSVNFASLATSLVVTNPYVTTNSIINATVATHDTNMTSVQVVAANGSFTLFAPVAPALETRVNFEINY